jgi:Protein of unknown function (DUF1207)
MIRDMSSLGRTGIAAVCCLILAGVVEASPVEDAYLEGYAAGLLSREFGFDFSGIKVRRGVMKVPVGGLEPNDRTQVLQILATIPGVFEVRPTDRLANQKIEGSAEQDGLRMTGLAGSSIYETGSLPGGQLFKPLLADPRWAHFSAAFRNYVDDELDGNDNASVSFGETLPFYRSNFGATAAQWELGLQAGVFSEFNLDARSSDLINSDFVASIYSSFRMGTGSAFLRVYHQSSHLGDEFLLQTDLERVNLSYEGVDLRFSWEVPHGLRFYAGGGGIFHKEPSTVGTWSAQYGAEFRSPWRFEFVALRPIAGVDVQLRDQNDWSEDVVVRAGLQLDNVVTYGRTLQFLLEYSSGYSPAGQFFGNKVDYFGFGAHYNY